MAATSLNRTTLVRLPPRAVGERAVFRSLDEAASALDGQPALPAGQLSVNSSYFLVRGVIRFDRVEAATEALLARNGQKIELLWQQRY